MPVGCTLGINDGTDDISSSGTKPANDNRRSVGGMNRQDAIRETGRTKHTGRFTDLVVGCHVSKLLWNVANASEDRF